jgi:uridine phosphorylase
LLVFTVVQTEPGLGSDGGVRVHNYSLDGNEDRNLVRLLVDMATNGWEPVGAGTMEIRQSNRKVVVMSKRLLPHIGLTIGGISPDVIVCGDPGRASKIAEFSQDARLLADQREYRSFIGTFDGLSVTVCSHGIGAPGAAIAFEELIVAGARRILRVGTCGGLQPEVIAGHLVIATAAVQNTGYAREIAPQGYPAVADPQLTMALQQTAERSNHVVHSGLILTRDAFYGGVQGPRLPDYKTMAEANVLAVEMECAALFTIGSLRGVRTGAILAVDGNVLGAKESVDTFRPHRDTVAKAVEASIRIALQALGEKTKDMSLT